VGISTRAGFSTFEEKLRELGFKNDIESKFIGRYKINGIIVDFMPIEENVLGFSNKWYKTGIEQSFLHRIDNDTSIRLMPFHYFIASKIEAHNSRNKADLRTSKDFEDIVYSFDNRLDPLKDMQEARGDVASYLKRELDDFMESPNFDEGVHCHLTPASASSRFRRIKGIWSAFTMNAIDD
jgi:hypothetical protein